MKRRSSFAIVPLVLFLSVAVSSCGGGGSPTSPSSTPAATGTKIIALTGSLAFGEVTVGSSKESTVTVTNSGSATLSFSGITASGGLTTHSAASPTSGSIPPGGNLAVLFRFTPTAAGTFSGTVTFSADHTSGTNTIAMAGTGVAAPTPPITLVGLVTDAATRRPLGGVRVSALTSAVANVGSATTDGNGYYSMVIPSATALSISYSLTGYDFQSSTITFTADTRRDVTLSVASPALEYRVTGSRASLTYSNCTAGTSQVGAANLPWSFTCSSVPSGQFVYISAQNTGDSGTVTVSIYKRGVLYRTSSSTGAFVIATASGSY